MIVIIGQYQLHMVAPMVQGNNNLGNHLLKVWEDLLEHLILEELDHLKILEVLLPIIEVYLLLIFVMFLLNSEEFHLQNIEECHLQIIKGESTEEECLNQWIIAVIIVEMSHQEVLNIEVGHLQILGEGHLKILEEDHHLIIEGYLHLQILEGVLHLNMEEVCLHLHLNIEECLLQIIEGLHLNMEEAWIQEDYHLKN